MKGGRWSTMRWLVWVLVEWNNQLPVPPHLRGTDVKGTDVIWGEQWLFGISIYNPSRPMPNVMIYKLWSIKRHNWLKYMSICYPLKWCQNNIYIIRTIICTVTMDINQYGSSYFLDMLVEWHCYGYQLQKWSIWLLWYWFV